MPEPVTPAEARKIVTVLFVDIADSTPLGERLDAESFRALMTRYFEAVRRVLSRHGGTVEKYAGDAVMAVFGIPVLHEDDALRAVRAAAEINDAIATLNDEIEQLWGVRIAVRTGINTGEVVAGDRRAQQALVTGDAVNLAAKLEEVAPVGRVLIGQATYRLVKDAVYVEPVDEIILNGGTRPLAAFELKEVIGGAPGVARRLESPLVGRDEEMRMLLEAFDKVGATRSCQLVTIAGSAGVGKTRLVAEALAHIADAATVVRGRCLSYGEGITFWPLGEAVKQAAAITEDDDPHDVVAKLAARLDGEDDPVLITGPLAQMMGLTDLQAATGEIFWAARRLFESLARTRPIVIVFDDIHWAEPTFLELVEHIVDWSRDASILVVCMTRPELFDEHDKWGTGRPNTSTIVLESLSDDECERLIENLLGAKLVADVRERILDVTEGTPLFIEEMVAMLIDEALLRRVGEEWVPTEDLTELRVPASVHALLAARVDKLEDREREVLERAAVVGKVFYRDAVERLTSKDARRDLDLTLESLIAKELIREGGDFAGGRAYRFRHILFADAAYRGIPKKTRALLHEQFAGWLEWNPNLRYGEYEEIVGYHLERSYGYRRELGAVDDHARSLASGASARLASAGRRALARSDLPAAANLLERAAALLSEEDPSRLDLMLDLARSLYLLGDSRFGSVLDDVESKATATGDERAAARAVIERYQKRTVTQPEEEWKDDAREDALRAIPIFQKHGDELGLARACQLLAECHWYEARHAAAEPYLERALAHARRAKSALEEAGNVVALSTAKFAGPTPVDEAIDWCGRALASGSRSNRWLQASVRLRLAGLTAMRGDFDEARLLAAEATSELEELHLAQALLAARETWADIELFAGNPRGAEEQLRHAYELSQSMKEPLSIAQFAGQLAEALYRQARYEEAEELLDVATAIGGPRMERAFWAVVRAKLLARRGHLQEAETLARENARVFEATDGWTLRGAALLGLAEVLTLAGKENEALNPLRDALEMFEQKGIVPLMDQVRSMRSELSVATR